MSLISDGWAFLTTASNWSGPRGIATRLEAHVWISFISVFLATIMALPLAVWLAHKRLLATFSVALANLGRALPSFAIIALVLPISIRFGFGLGFWPTAIALVALAIPPIYTNAYLGVQSTPDDQIEAARGVGMTGQQVLRRVEFPSALPLIMTGLRIAAVQVVATATLGALVGYQNLGSFVVEGMAAPRVSRDKLIGGAVLVALLAVVVEVTFALMERGLTPWKRRLRSRP